jgi:hypothetical protein
VASYIGRFCLYRLSVCTAGELRGGRCVVGTKVLVLRLLEKQTKRYSPWCVSCEEGSTDLGTGDTIRVCSRERTLLLVTSCSFGGCICIRQSIHGRMSWTRGVDLRSLPVDRPSLPVKDLRCNKKEKDCLHAYMKEGRKEGRNALHLFCIRCAALSTLATCEVAGVGSTK